MVRQPNSFLDSPRLVHLIPSAIVNSRDRPQNLPRATIGIGSRFVMVYTFAVQMPCEIRLQLFVIKSFRVGDSRTSNHIQYWQSILHYYRVGISTQQYSISRGSIDILKSIIDILICNVNISDQTIIILIDAD